MTKRTITIWWLVGAGVMIVGGLLTLFSSLALAAHIGALTSDFQPDVTFVPDGYFWTLVSFILLGGFAVLGGIIVQFVAWIGAVGQDEIRDHYADSDVFCLPSFAEGVPIVLMEAMAMELALRPCAVNSYVK